MEGGIISVDITTLALAKKFAKEYTDTHASKLTEEDAVRAVANYFNENPNAIVTNDELEIILNEYFKKDDLSDLEDIRTGAALGATALQEHQDISGKADKTDIENVIYYEDGEESDVDEVVLMSEFEVANNELKDSIVKTKSVAERAEVIARGKATAYIYDTVEDLDTSLTDKEFVSNLVVGDNFYIRALDVPDYWWDGTQKQQLESEKPDLTNTIKDVIVNGQSFVSDGIATIPMGSYRQYGVFLENQADYMKSSHTRGGSRVITGYLMDYAVRLAMCDGYGKEWTNTDKTGAWIRLNYISLYMDDIAVAGAQYYLGEQIAVSVVLPDNAEIGQMITVCWYNGNHAATLSITGTMLDFDFTPSANTRSEINALWDGTYWAVLGNEMSVPREVTA